MTDLVLNEVSLNIAGQPLFAPLSLRVEAGTVTSLVGPSGVGKSSLLAYICGTLAREFRPQGQVSFGDQVITQLAAEQRGIGILFQESLLFPHLSVRGNLLFGLKGGQSRRVRHRSADEALRSVGLAGFGDRDPATLSGGQKARVALLRVLLAEPRALLLDEAFNSLDEVNRDKIRALVFTEIRERQLPALMVTHDHSDIVAAAGPVVTLTSLQGGSERTNV